MNRQASMGKQACLESDTLEIIGVPQSTFVRTVRMACEEKGVAYRLTSAIPCSPEVSAIHPFGKIPVMRHGDFNLFESKAIATYIDRAFLGPRLFPDEARGLAQVEQWVSVVNTTIVPVLMSYLQAYFFRRLPNGEPDRAAVDKALPEVRAHLAHIAMAVADTGHLGADRFTYADMNLLPVMAYLLQCPESADEISASPSLSGYFARHSQRPSFVATEPPPFSELRR